MLNGFLFSMFRTIKHPIHNWAVPPSRSCLAVFLSLIFFPLLPAHGDNEENNGWFSFGPPATDFPDSSVIDLRYLNEAHAGENGWIHTDGHRFVHENTGEQVRFWGVNSPAWDHYSMADWQYMARLLAKYGVNLLRLHGSLLHGFAYTRTNQSPDIDPMELSPDKLEALMKAVAAMKAEGIYVHLSIYFPLWMQPPSNSWEFPGYDGSQKPFAAIYFNENLEERYDSWWRTVLNTVNPYTGIAIKDDPAVMSLELVNEDSLFFNTFSYRAIPGEQMAILETSFAKWLEARYGSLENIGWLQDFSHERDDLNNGRMGFGELRTMARRKSPRDRDTVRFLFETQRDWYRDKVEVIRKMGFKGLVTASNWITANDYIYDSLERASYMAGDFIDHHKAYFQGAHKGENASWSIRNGHTYYDRNQMTFEAAVPSDGKKSHEIHFIKPTWNNMPSMISETAWNRPNRYRSQGAGLYATYGSLSDMDAIVHFTMDTVGRRWFVQPRYVMQQWSLLTPGVMGQFPAAALIYRKGLIKEAGDAAVLELNLEEQLALKGMDYGQMDGIDNLRATEEANPAKASPVSIENKLRPLIGKMRIDISDKIRESVMPDLSSHIDVGARQLSSLTGELNLDWGEGYLRIDAPSAQGFLITQGTEKSLETSDIALATDAEILNLLMVSLDSLPLAQSKKILLQVMTEEKAFGFQTEPVADHPGQNRILDIGVDPWLVKSIQGRITLSGDPVKVTVLDQLGLPGEILHPSISQFELLPDSVYYLLER